MRVNWFSPLPPAMTDIGHYTARILPSLNGKGEVTLWTDQNEWASKLEAYARTQNYQINKVHWAMLNRTGVSIYNIGNNPYFHEAIWQVSRYHPGIVVLHDLRLQHLFAGIFLRLWQDDEGYLTHMSHYYGTAGQEAAKEFWNGKLSIEYMAEYFPLTELALENALGVLVHTREAFDLLKEKRRWPVAYAPLPYPAKPLSSNDWINIEKKYREQLPYRLIVFGYIGANRRLETILKALASFPGREKFRLDILGDIYNADEIENLILSFGLFDLVKVHGFASEDKLDNALAAAHLGINLRYPSMGEASASQLRLWNHALPSLVTRTGWYAGLPEEAVAFVRSEYEIEDIHFHLNAFLESPECFARMGQCGRRVLEDEHTPSAYADIVVDLVHYAQAFRPKAVALGLAERVGRELSTCMDGIAPDEAIVSASRQIYTLLLSAR